MPPVDADSKFARHAWLRALAETANLSERGLILPQLVEQLAERFEAAPALSDADSAWSFRELSQRANRYTRFALASDLAPGAVVALLMSNCVDYLALWLGLTRIGAVAALINPQLTGEVLAHSINAANPQLIIAGTDTAPSLQAVRAKLRAELPCLVLGECAQDMQSLAAATQRLSLQPVAAAECAYPSIDRSALYIYTSGTTGLPKAAVVSHLRLLQWSHWFAGMMDTQPQDRMFNCLPLYHSVGGVVAVFAPLLHGGSVVIRKRFSASDFWRDVRAEGCTLFQYIGELCRYLVNSPTHALEAEHALRLACGNGLRPEIWQAFQSRFRIPRILEYYASTEGNFSLYNCEGEVGAIGRIPAFLAGRVAVALLRFDVDAGAPLRNAQGRCELCAVDEVGEAVAMVPADDAGGGRFEGYADPAATARKLLHDVFEPGDRWYRSGDLMRRDSRGFYYFVDRIGETYRWKGENVSTAEVLSVLCRAPGVRDGVVYGVRVPGAEGRAGMAALVVDASFDFAVFRSHAAAHLPACARPLFVRIISALEATGTFKPRKQDLAAAGFDPQRVADPVYFDDARAARYVPVEAELYARICSGAMRV